MTIPVFGNMDNLSRELIAKIDSMSVHFVNNNYR